MSAMKLSAETLRRLVRESLETSSRQITQERKKTVAETFDMSEMEELDEDMMPASMHPSVGDRKPPPLPQKKPGGGPPNLKGFKADCNMMADAASRVKQILDAGQGDTKEALRWLDKVVQFAQSAQKNLKN